MKKSLNEKQVLKKLNIKSFSEVTTDKAISFSSMLPHMNPDVAKKALEQFPDFIKRTTIMIACGDVILRCKITGRVGTILQSPDYPCVPVDNLQIH